MQQEKVNTANAATYLKERYDIPATEGTLAVWRCYGKGPRYHKVARWVLYSLSDLDKFAKGRAFETTDSVEI